MRKAPSIKLTREERDELSKTALRQTGAMRDTLRERIILLAADGLKNQEIAQTLGTSGKTVGKWRRRFHQHFIPISSSWLNMVERFFGKITAEWIRRGAFKSVLELTEAIHSYIEAHNRNPKPYVRTKTAEEFINKLKPVYQITNITIY